MSKCEVSLGGTSLQHYQDGHDCGRPATTSCDSEDCVLEVCANHQKRCEGCQKIYCYVPNGSSCFTEHVCRKTVHPETWLERVERIFPQKSA